ncbi:MAG: baseplate assembly protein [Candidatus Devosia phytovorans]|uniref:Baseplate assembly protein n=1 Tax=Candidatus Devosia phytovorans TaxID=3121372 RepID=A0AAJ5VUW3_9HYPH|nr:baseplate assembly protein [Devosia sp.]WEK04561.1 MAG: baseplate assembly protein [Devosia sp.]
MISEIVAQRADIEQLKTLFGRMLRVGSIAVVDPEKGFRVKWGNGPKGEPFLSPFYPHPESGGATSTWFPLSEGQIVGVINPGGDPKQGLLIRGGFSGENAAPSGSLDENVLKFGSVKITIGNDGAVTIDAAQAVTVNAPLVDLGGTGGKPVARVGDMVRVTGGSSSGLWPIVEGSSVVNAV